MRTLYEVYYFLAFSLFYLHECGNCSRRNPIILSSNETREIFIKNITRARLWSPYSTIATKLDTNTSNVSHNSLFQEKADRNSNEKDDDNETDVNPIFSSEKQEKELTPIIPRQAPIISSIRHYKSRKIFSRTRKISNGDTRSTTSFPSATSILRTDIEEPKVEEDDDNPKTEKNKEIIQDYQGDQSDDGESELKHSPLSTTASSLRRKSNSDDSSYVYGSPNLIPRANTTTKDRKNINRIISFLAENNNGTTQIHTSKRKFNSSKKQGKNNLRNLNIKELPSTNTDPFSSNSDPEADRTNRVKELKKNLSGSESTDKLDAHRQRTQSDSSSSNKDKNEEIYDEEIPLVFIPGVVPSFDESEYNFYEDKERKGDFLEGPEEYNVDETVGGTSQWTTNKPNGEREDMDIVTKFLRVVEERTADNCTAGTELTLGQGVVDRYAQERFQREAEVAVNRANMLTRLWKYARDVMSNEYLLHASLFSMIEFDDDIFAAGNCYDEHQYKNYTLFCPFAYRLPEGNILVKDLAVEYKYLSNTSEFFYVARKNAERVIKLYNQFSRGYNSYTFNESAHTEIQEEVILNVTYEDGKWSKPYFDCGGGNIWMMTYTVPFFDFQNDTYFFKGTSGIDIDLRRVDIDQCPLPENSTVLNIFAGSDKCKNSTTKCVPVTGLGFRRGSYRCNCKPGFYFPNVSSPLKYFNGSLLEEEYENKFMGRVSRYDVDGAFECLLCSYGCETCEDDRPCVVSLNWLMRSGILILQCVIILMLPMVGVFTWKYSEVKVVRAASPVLLRFIVLGAFFIYCTILVMYPSPSIITCTLRVWFREIGFSLAYGALMLKTWRISVIFRVRSAKAIKITDLDLMKRLGMIVAMFFALLVIRTLVAPPTSILSYTADELKAWLCKTDWWDHSFTIMELSLLVWGIRLCIVVRKAPSEFNESKFISLAIYNEFLLSLFLNISMFFLQSPANPDLLYIIFFCHVQLTMTLLLCLIFGSKAYMVFRGHGKGGGSDESRTPTAKFISKNRGTPSNKQLSISGQNSGGTGLQVISNATLGLDQNAVSTVVEDDQTELSNLYTHLGRLKERYMKLGNRPLVAKIMAMQESAYTIIANPAEKSAEALIQPAPNLPSPKIEKDECKTASEVAPVEDTSSIIISHISKSDRTLIQEEKAIEPHPGKKRSLPISRTEPENQQGKSGGEIRSQTSDVDNGDYSLLNPESTTEVISNPPCPEDDDDLEYMDVCDYEEEDEVGNSIRMTVTMPLDRIRSNNQEDKTTTTEDDGGKIPTSVIRLNASGVSTSSQPLHHPLESGTELSPIEGEELSSGNLEQASSSVVSNATNQSQPNSTQVQASNTSISKKNNKSSGTTKNSSGGKIILDLDDKSRFTDEITV